MEFVSLEKKALIRPVVIAAAIVGSIQGFFWTFLSFTAILYYYGCVTGTGNSIYENYIYDFFLDKNAENYLGFTLTPDKFNILMYFYIFMSFVWLLLSLFILWKMIREKWTNLPVILACWSAITLAIAILDVTSVGLVAADYWHLQNLELKNINGIHFVQNQSDDTAPTTINDDFGFLQAKKTNISITYIIVMTALGRGYILWLVNFIFAIILAKFSCSIFYQKEPPRHSFINGYGTSSHAMNLYEETVIDNGNVNASFEPDDDLIFRRNDDHTGNKVANSNNASFLHKYRTDLSPRNDKVAKIGKANGGCRTPPLHISPPNVPNELKYNNLPRIKYNYPILQNVEREYVNPNMPYIPEPDYTPPATPKLLPTYVLRPRSNYVI